MKNPMTTPLTTATGDVRDKLIELAERHEDDIVRPCCDGETTLAEWVEGGFISTEQVLALSS